MSYVLPFGGNRVDQAARDLAEASERMYSDIAYADYKRRHYLEVAIQILQATNPEDVDSWLDAVDRLMERAGKYARKTNPEK